MRLATWNVNSLKVRLSQVLDWRAEHRPDVLCLQEAKLEDKAFPRQELESVGYHNLFSGQKTYNGVAVLTRSPAQLVADGIPGFDDDQKRFLAADVDGVRVVCAYFPNGQALDSHKYQYKLRWIGALNSWLKTELDGTVPLALLGDYNIAPEDRDVHDPKAWEGQVLCSPPEREAFRALVDLGLTDAFRRFEQPEQAIKGMKIGDGSDLAVEAGTGDEESEDTGAAFEADESEFNVFNTDRKLFALESAAKMLANLPEKKAFVYFSSGVGKTGMENQPQLRSTVNAAVRANISFYPVDARGLTALIPGGDASQGASRGSGLFSGQSQPRQQTSFQDQQETLVSLASDTGGKAFLDNNDLSLGIQQAQNDILSYYILGYYSTNPAAEDASAGCRCG